VRSMALLRCLAERHFPIRRIVIGRCEFGDAHFEAIKIPLNAGRQLLRRGLGLFAVTWFVFFVTWLAVGGLTMPRLTDSLQNHHAPPGARIATAAARLASAV
jgi:hypothetical protein